MIERSEAAKLDPVAALREVGTGDDAVAAHATRLRVRRSLERGHSMQRHVASVLVALGILFVASASWALATGQIQKLWHRAETVTPARVLPRAAAPAPTHERIVVTQPPPVVPEPTQPLAPPPVVKKAVTKPVEVLYRKAHQLYFHGGDYAAALAAWDAYLAAEPTGRFAIEARYNRALCLVRLARLAEGRDALLPFAHGEVEPAGYRRDEAQQMVDKITPNLVNGTP